MKHLEIFVPKYFGNASSTRIWQVSETRIKVIHWHLVTTTKTAKVFWNIIRSTIVNSENQNPIFLARRAREMSFIRGGERMKLDDVHFLRKLVTLPDFNGSTLQYRAIVFVTYSVLREAGDFSGSLAICFRRLIRSHLGSAKLPISSPANKNISARKYEYLSSKYCSLPLSQISKHICPALTGQSLSPS